MISTQKTYNNEFEIIVISNPYHLQECQEIYASTNKVKKVAKENMTMILERLDKNELITIIESEIEEKLKKIK